MFQCPHSKNTPRCINNKISQCLYGKSRFQDLRRENTWRSSQQNGFRVVTANLLVNVSPTTCTYLFYFTTIIC